MEYTEGEFFTKNNIRYKYVRGQSRRLCIGANNTCTHLRAVGKLCVGHKNGTVRTPNSELQKGDIIILNNIRYVFNGIQKVRLCNYNNNGKQCEQAVVKGGMCKTHSPHWRCKFTGYSCNKIRTQGDYCVQHIGNKLNYVTMTKEQFIIDATTIHHGYYSYDEIVFINATEKIKIRCPEHGLFEQRPCEHLRPRNCPRCKFSQGELKIGHLLRSLNLEFEDQVKFDSCRSDRLLPFDFWISKYCLLIEFDGRQHFEEIDVWSEDKITGGLVKRINRDIIKDNWCINNGKYLLRISYKDIDNIEEIITEAFDHIKILRDESDAANPIGCILATSFYETICIKNNGIRDTSHYMIIA